MVRESKGLTQKGKGKGSPQKKKKMRKRNLSADQEEPGPVAKKMKKDVVEPEFSYIRFKFLLRSADTVAKGLQKFLDMCGDEEEEESKEGLQLLDSYLKSSPQCSEVIDLLTPKTSSQEISLVFAWIKMVLQKCQSVTKEFSELQQHLVKTLLTRHGHLMLNSLRRGNKTSFVKSTLMLLITIASLGHKFAVLLHSHMDFTHANWPGLLSRRDRKDEIDVRACVVAILMTLLQAEEEDVTRSLVEQRVLLQDVLLGLKYDRSEYVVHTLNTIHRCIVMNGSIGKNSKIYLFSSPVLKELLALYRWPGPSQWKRQPTDDEKEEYSEEQQKVAEWVHPVLVDLLTNHKLGICFRDKSYGTSKENKNPAVSKVLQLLVTSFTSPLSHQLVTAVLHACPDQTPPFLRLLQPHLAPQPVDTWIACLNLFLKIVENHEWPSELTDNADLLTEERAPQVVHFLFPPEPIVNSLKEGLKSPCATVRHQCLQAIQVVAKRGRHFYELSKTKLGSQAPLTLGIEGSVSKTLPNGQVLLNLLQKLSSDDSFAVPITRQLYKDKDVALPHVSRFQHLVAILRMYSLTPEHLTGGPADTLPSLLQLVAQVAGSLDEVDKPPEGTPRHLPSLFLLHALSECDARKLNLFGKGGSKGDPKSSLVYQLVTLMQSQSGNIDCSKTACSLIGKLLAGTGLFEGHQGELQIWLRHLECSETAPGEVVTFFVGLLRQYMSNPYPAIDRLLELVEGALQSTDSSVSGLRQEFSPLVMFALDGEFHTHKKVHQYVCSVLIDILHTLHKPGGFSRLVHSLSSNLDPEVTLYLTLHSTEEKLTTESLSKRLSKRLRLKQLKTFGHHGVSVMKKFLKDDGEGVERTMEILCPDARLSLVHQCLRYLDELVSGSVRTQGELLNPKLGDVCMETLRAACLQVKTADTDTTSSSEEPGNTREELNHLKLPQLKTDWLRSVADCVMSHPLVSLWLFEEGFKEVDTPRTELVVKLCDIIQSMHLGDQNVGITLPFDVTSKCQHMLQAASESVAGVQRVPERVQPLLCTCLEALLSAGGLKKKLEGFLTLVSLPVHNFKSEHSQTPSPLGEIMSRLADRFRMQVDSKIFKDVSGQASFESSLKGLFALISVSENPSLAFLALDCVQNAGTPWLWSLCSAASFQGMLRRFETEECGALLLLLECLMRDGGQYRSLCGQWLQKKKKVLEQGKPLIHRVMLLYLRLFESVEESAADDVGVQAIAEVVWRKMDSRHVPVDQLDSIFLQIICYLVNLDVLEPWSVNTLQDSLLSTMQEEAELCEGHVQLLAATLRHQSLRACDPQLGADDPRSELKWRQFETQAGRVLVACVRFLTSSRMTTGGGDEEDGKHCSGYLVHLCQDLLCLAIEGEVKAAILSFWPDVVTCCLKYNYKNAQYIALLRQIVQRLFTKEEQANKDDVDLDAEEETENKNAADTLPRQESSDEDDGNDEDEDHTVTVASKQTSVDPKSEAVPKHAAPAPKTVRSLSAIVNQRAKRLRLNEKSAVAKRCPNLFYCEETSLRSDIVSQWTDPTHKSFFLWPSESTSMLFHIKTTLSSPADGSRMVELCEKVVGHTAFLSVMQEQEHRRVRGELVSLLVCLVRLQTSCCSCLPLNVLLAAYGATLSLTDQNLLYLMLACDLYGNQRFSPGVWGEKAVERLEARREGGRSLRLETTLEDVLHLLDLDVMATSILHFPLLRPAEFHLSECAVKAERLMSREECYDPRFLLQLIFHFMGVEHVVDVRSFIARKGLGFTLAALSSHDPLMRRLAIGILSNLHSHVEMVQRWSAAPILLAFLRVVMNGLTREGQKLPCVVTVFLAKAADFVMVPESDMYVAIHSFLMLKPALDVSNVPEFYNFFNSPNPKERLWILRLLQDGLRETGDHRLFQRRYVYKLLMCHASSSLSDPQTRRESLKVLVKASSVATVIRDLVTSHGLLPWLLAFAKDYLPDTPEMTRLACQLLHNACYTPEFNQRRLWWLSLPRLSRRCLLHVPLLACVQLLLGSFSRLEQNSLQLLDDIVRHPYLSTSFTPSLLPQVPH
ncbi:nucleolar pre-ribosomal-associated protein 1-like [Babylonia areolata]|uniref:nucleolar pre-ribosomal-associated protein 1-like n=1 Tax=Babylonia areolata TaxID=304850 RepID=UPI003FD0BBAA